MREQSSPFEPVLWGYIRPDHNFYEYQNHNCDNKRQ